MDEKQTTQMPQTQAQTQTPPAGPRPYYRKELLQRQLAALLAQVHGTLIPSRGKVGVTVYAIDGGGEAMVTKQPSGTLVVELFKGKCPC
jgi:hypothetical protein